MKVKTLVEIDQSTIDLLATPPMTEKNFNGLTAAQTERLVILQEELAESIQAVSKIMRHGYQSVRPGASATSNRLHLQDELGHVQNAITMLVNAKDLSREAINAQELHKSVNIGKYLHHN